MESTQGNKKKQVRTPLKPGIKMVVRVNNPAIAVRLRYNCEKLNSKLYFMMSTLPETKLPNQVIQQCKNNISKAISTMGVVVRDNIEKLDSVLKKNEISIPKREDSPGKVVEYTSNSRSFSELVVNIDLVDQAIWMLDSLSIALLISEEKKVKNEKEFMSLLNATEVVINSEHHRVIGMLKSDGKVNEVAVAMPVDKNVIPEPLNHPLIGIEGIHKVKNELVMVDHPVRSYADSKPAEKVDSTPAPELKSEVQ